jgi:hypothetical protein
MRSRWIAALLAGLAACAAGGQARTGRHPERYDLTLPPAVRSPRNEISGLAWAGDRLLLLPQHPERAGVDGGSAPYWNSRAELERAAASSSPAGLVEWALDQPCWR